MTHSAYEIQHQSKRRSTPPLYPGDEHWDEKESPAWIADQASKDETLAEQNELSKILRRKVDELPVAYRSVLALIDLFDFDYKETASVLGVPVSTVKRRLAHARLLIANLMREEGS